MDAEAETALAPASTTPPEAVLDYAFEKNARVRVEFKTTVVAWMAVTV